MNTIIRDKTSLEAIRPLEAATYLRSNGWAVLREQPGQYSVWEKRADGEEAFEIVLPLDTRYRDYALRLSDLLQTLQIAEDRSQTEIYSDIQTTSADVIALVENAGEMMLASACATIEPRGYYAASKPERAREYVRRLRMGQSEIGSYVVRILSPVSPRLQLDQGALVGEPEAPFERRVTVTLIRSLTVLRATADEAVNSGKLDGFQQAVEQGVSANLCSALVKMAGSGRSSGASLAVSLSWARS